jgi:GDP/UDP-N,N'-diacetylbacillosamine 2-epimerase (hydrolysing)
MKKIAVLTTSRADYGILSPILKEILKRKSLKLELIVSGSHLSPNYGYTINEIEKDGFKISSKIEMLLASDTPSSISKSIGIGVIGFTDALVSIKPDILILLGDRFETLSCAIAALPLNIKIAHIHGGEETEGAFDNSIRHSITMMAHLHFASTREYAKRIVQMVGGNEKVFFTGAPALDNLKYVKFYKEKEFEKIIEFPLNPKPLLITFHPVTREIENTKYYIKELLSALKHFNLPLIFTMPNQDTYNSIIRKEILNFSKDYKNSKVFENLGTEKYFNLMKYSKAMVGNSSSGIIEAPSFKLPVANIGTRQEGRIKAKNVIDVGYKREEIIKGIEKAISKEFKDSLKNLKNPYGDGKASKKIVDILEKELLK